MKNLSSVEHPIVLWNLTNECNLHCAYCYQNAGKRTYEQPQKQKIEIVNELITSGVSGISFAGGEVLLRKKELYELSGYASRRDLLVSIITNATLLNKKVAKKLVESGVKRASINLDSADRKVHDSYRGETGCWERTLEGVFSSVEAGLETEISATLTQRNFGGLENFLQLGSYLGVSEIEVTTLVPTGRGKYMQDEMLNPEQMKTFLEIAAEHYLKGQKIMLSTNPEFVPFLKEKIKKSGRDISKYSNLNKDIGCAAGVWWCAIQPDGLVTPCVLMPDLVVGDLKKQLFSSIWQDSPLFKKLRDRDNLKGNCGSCDYKENCGGCRARAYYEYNDILSGHPNCVVYGGKDAR